MTVLHDAARVVDPLGDADSLDEQSRKRNRAKVGSGRPSSLLYTYGPGAIMDLPQFTIMPTGLDDWDRIWNRRDGDPPAIHAPRLRDAVRKHMRSRDVQLRPFPWQPKQRTYSSEGNDLGVPARVFPQWLRCTGCDLLGKVSQFEYVNTQPYRTDLARFEHVRCPGRSGSGRGTRTAVPARYLLACVNGHLDEFPYEQWVHHGGDCPEAEFPRLRMTDRTSGKGASATIRCDSCGMRRAMNEAQGPAGAAKLPRCRGRHPHLDGFEFGGCGAESKLMLIGASNLWFGSTLSIIVMPESDDEKADDLVHQIRVGLGAERLAKYAGNLPVLRDFLDAAKVDVSELSDPELSVAVSAALAPPPSDDEQEEQLRNWDPVDLLVPEWRYLQDDPLGERHEDPASGLTLSRRVRGPRLRDEITRVLAVERLRKVNALTGFTRIDSFDRAGDAPGRLVRLAREQYPKWTVATEDRGEGIFLQLDEDQVAEWERRVLADELWESHRLAHRRNFNRRFSDTAEKVEPDDRLKPPRYWLVHTLAHVLIRQMAMECGYQAASLSERLYAWPGSDDRPPAAGLLIVTTASDSDGTLGGLVSLSEPSRLERVVSVALERATRCSSDPVCARRTPMDPEDFLHGAACHCCVMASETSCERANRFLDRKFLVNLPGSELGFFG